MFESRVRARAHKCGEDLLQLHRLISGSTDFDRSAVESRIQPVPSHLAAVAAVFIAGVFPGDAIAPRRLMSRDKLFDDH